MINKKAHPRGRNQNQNDKSSDSIVDLIMGKKTFDDYNKDSDINDNENENEKNQLDNLSQNNNSNDDQNNSDNNDNNDNDINDNNNDNNNNNNNNDNNNDESSTISHARKPNTSNKSIVTVSMPSRLRKPMPNRGNPHIMQNNNNDNNNNNKLLNKIDILEAKIIKLEAKIKILNLQMNSILENHS
ncbi:hypothetical protein [Acanthamoeba polyphaga mimivirus]|uniref:Uncharacterized protein n=2 Tax=Megamimivirinae TaxID=3044648 RepID=A0A2L2DJK4_MIMIV|nr:hypothetical protein [Acanthamoeba polyphaga mimivirus]AVG47452.1 hypothetical protein [Acanthamoeba polyphaga mimivirus]